MEWWTRRKDVASRFPGYPFGRDMRQTRSRFLPDRRPSSRRHCWIRPQLLKRLPDSLHLTSKRLSGERINQPCKRQHAQFEGIWGDPIH